MNLNELTLLILVRDRQYNIPKIEKYYQDLKCKKIIYDTSVDKYKHKIHNSFDYIWTIPTPYWKTLPGALSYIDTKYILDNADDDIVLIDAIYDCYKFLIEHSDYSACIGETCVYEKNELISKQPEYINAVKDKRFESDNINDRLSTFVNSYFTLFHGMLKTTITRKLAHLISYESLQPINFSDRLQYLLCCLEGKIKIVNIPYQIRSTEHRLVERVDLRDEYKQRIRFQDNINKETLSPLKPILELHNITLNTIIKILEQHFGAKHKHDKGEIQTFKKEHKTLFENLQNAKIEISKFTYGFLNV